MTELATEHVRMLDAGRQRVGYSSPLTSSSFASVGSRKTQLLQHGNTFGLSFVGTETGFTLTTNDALETSCADYTKRRQEAMDHGQKLTLEEIHKLPVTKEVQLPSIAYWIALSPDELTVAVAYADAVALFEVAHIVQATTPAPFHTFSKLQAQEIAWCTDTASELLAVLTVEKQVFVCTLAGDKTPVEVESEASSIAWSPSGEQIAVGLVSGTIDVYERDTLQIARSISPSKSCADAGLEVHHVNWAEDDLILAGYQNYDEEMEETTALACIYENDSVVPLDEIVGFFDVDDRRHQYFTVFLPDWRMFFIGCSLSADIELLVSDPDNGEWELWKPLEKYQARLPMNADDEESFPMGFALNLNSTLTVPVDEDAFPPVPIVSCANTEGILVNFGFVDTTVHDVLEFVKSPVPFGIEATRIAVVKAEPQEVPKSLPRSLNTQPAEITTEDYTPSKKSISHEYGQNDVNEFAESDGESSDEEEERKEEEDKAKAAFHSVASDGADFIVSEHFSKLFKTLGATYDEEEHASILKRLEKDGKVYEADFILWYVNWIFGDDDSDSDVDEDAPASSAAGSAEMKSKEEIAAAFSKFTAKEGSWKCATCMLSNSPEAVKCTACETPNPAAPKAVVPVAAASATSAGSIGSGGFSFPVATGGTTKPSSFSFGVTPGTSSESDGATKSTGFSFGGAATTTGFGFPSSTPSTGFSFPTSTKPATGFSFGTAASTSSDGHDAGGNVSKSLSVFNEGASGLSVPASSKNTVSHEYGQSDENEFAESDGEGSDEEEERMEEEDKARNAFHSVASNGSDFITSNQFPKLFKTLGATYDDEEHASILKRLQRDGKVYEIDFISWYLDWIFGDSESDSEEENDEHLPPKKAISHEYGQNDVNEFAESDGESSDEEEERKEEEDKAKAAFHSVASDGADFIVSEHFSKLFKTLGATYDEEEHASTLKRLEKDGKVYEADFILWYVNWIFGDDDSDSDVDEDAPASSAAGSAEMKSKEEIAAAFSKFTAKEGSWKCATCMLSNSPEAVKCTACETPNPAAPKAVVPVAAASATSAGSIGSGGFSFPVATGGTTKPSSFSFGVTPGTSSESDGATKSTGFSFGGAATTTGFDFPSSTPSTGFSFPTSTKPATGFSFGTAKPSSTVPASDGGSSGYPPDTTSKPKPPAFDAASGSGYPPDTTSKPKPPAFGAVGSISGYPPDTTSKPKPPAFGAASGSGYPPDTTSKPKPPAFGAAGGSSGYPPDTTSKPKPPAFGAASGSGYPPDTTSKPKPPAFGAAGGSSGYPPDTTSKPKSPVFGAASGSGYPPDTTSKPKPPVFGAASGSGYPPDTTSKPKPPAFGAASGSGYPPDTTSKPKPPAFGAAGGSSGYQPDTTSKPKPPAFDAASGSGYPPDTTSKPKPPAFGAVGSISGYPPDTTSKPKPPAFGAASGSGYPPDTTSKPKPPAFGAAGGSSGYPPDTTSKPKPPAFGAASGSGYPPDTTSKPKPPAFGAAGGSSGYPPDTTSKPKSPVFGAASGSGYPPDTTSKPKPPVFGAASGSGYPPDTTSKPKPPAFGAASGSGYPPDTTSKPKPPAFGAAGGSSGYQPDTTSKPKPPVFGAASGSGYPPDTTSKPKPPVFGAASGSGYPPDTTSKPKPPAFGAASGSGYPPDTTSKPKPPAFGATTTASNGYPPDTSTKPKPPTFGQSTSSEKLTSSFGFGSFGKSLFGSSASSSTSAQTEHSTSTTTPTKTKSLFAGGFGSGAAVGSTHDTSSSPFGVVPKANSKNTFSFGAANASDTKESASKASTTHPSFSFNSVPSTLDDTKTSEGSEDRPRTKRTLKFGDMSAFEAKANLIPSTATKEKPIVAPSKTDKGIPSSRMEGQLWKLIVDFDKSLQRVTKSSKDISSKDPDFSKKFLATMDNLRTQISSLCDEINNLDESRDRIEKDVLFVIGSDGDVHEQLEYGREILNSFNDEALKRTLDEQPLDQRSKETRESLKDKLNEVEKCCRELDSHLSSSKIGADGTGAVSSTHLFRVLKQTYDNSKLQYNKACKLAEHLEKLSLRGERMRHSNGVGGISSVERKVHPVATKSEVIQSIVETEQRSQDVRHIFLSLCNNVVTPRDVSSAPRRKLAPPTPSDSSASPLRIKACSKLMPKTQLSVASPMSSAKQPSRSVSFKETPVKSGSKLFSLAEAMAPKDEPAKLVKTPQPAKPSVGVGKAPQRPSLGAPATAAKSTSSTAPKSNAFSFPKSSKDGASSFAAPGANGDSKKTSPKFGGFGVNSPAVKSKRKADEMPTSSFSLGGQEASAAPSAFSFGLKNNAQQPTTAPVSTDYKALLEKFYKVHNPSKSGSVIEKALATYKGREEDLFTRLFTMYVPDSKPEDVTKYLNGGPVPPKSETAAASSKSPAPANAASKSPFGGFGASAQKDTAAKPSPFGASPSAFSLGPAANTSSGFGAFGSAATSSSSAPFGAAAASPFGKPAVDYRQKLVEFYQQHNPSKLSSVDANLQKYKGNEEKLFQNLASKYKVNGVSGVPPASPAVQPAQPNAAASPFGKPGAFSSPTVSSGVTFGSASSVGFGAPKPAPAASPFGAASQTSSGFGAASQTSSGFGTASQTSSGFGSAGGSGFGGGFQSAAATAPSFGAPSPFGAGASGFGAGGVNYREKLTEFYQQHNPGKLNSVDATLEKYKGREDHLFSMLEQKYVKKTPTVPAAGGFGGIPTTTTFGGGSGFGTPSALGAASAAPAFGSASSLGGAAQPAFGASQGSGFGMASRMGGGFGSAAPAAPSGAPAGSGFSSFGSQTPTFGGSTQQSGGFGAAANSGGFGSGFGGAAASGGFGQPATFSNPSFTQMR